MSKKMGLFDFLNKVQQDQTIEFFDNLSDENKKSYKASRYMLHRFISMNPHHIPVVNILQMFTSIPSRAHYLFLTRLLPKKKEWNKYIKGNKESKYEAWLVDLISKHFSVSKKEAITYIQILYDKNRQELKNICKLYGIEEKQIKKLKL